MIRAELDKRDNFDIMTQIRRGYGREVNSEKNCVMIFNVREQADHLCNIKVVQKMKYLAIEIDNKEITSRHKEATLYKPPGK